MKVLLQRLLLLFGGLVISTSLFAQKAGITGKVIDADGNALMDVKIAVEGPVKAYALSDPNGMYSITNLMAGSYKLTFRYTSLSEKVVEVELAEGQSLTQNVTMTNDQAEDEVVVIGYGTTRTKDLTGSATVINEKNFLKGSLATPEQLIMGKVAGLKVTSNDGAPGSGSTLRLRGGTSINASNDPLIVVDGVPLDNGGIAGVANPLSLINPNDIESIDLLTELSEDDNSIE